MARQNEQDDDQVVIEDDTAEDVTDQADEQLDAQDEGETPEQGADDEQGEAGEGAEAADEVVVSIGDDTPAADEEEQQLERAPQWVKNLRKENRTLVRKVREAEAKLAAASAPAAAQEAAAVGPKPTLEACDFDAEKFEQQLEAWHSRKRAADDQQRQKDAAEAEARAQWQKKLDAYGTAKAALKVADFEDAEETARETFSVTQQGVILNGAENAALLVYALGKNPKKAKELAAITDPVKFAFAVAKLETQLKVTPRKTAPVPERAVRGSGSVAGAPGAVSANLERLRDEAQRTGNYDRYLAAKRQQQARKAA